MKNYSFLFAIGFLLISFTMKAQEKLSLELRPGLSFPTSDLGNTDAKIGYGFEFTGAYKLMPHLAAYAGWGWNQFKGEDSFSKDQITFDEYGYTFGFHIIRNIGTSSFSYFASAGAIYNRIKLENNVSRITADTDHGFGWQAALGIDYEFGYNFSLRPTLRYRSLSRNVEMDNLSTQLKLNHISFGIGLVRDF